MDETALAENDRPRKKNHRSWQEGRWRQMMKTEESSRKNKRIKEFRRESYQKQVVPIKY